MNPLNRAGAVLLTIALYSLFVSYLGHGYAERQNNAEKAAIALQTLSTASESKDATADITERVVYKDRVIKEKADVVTKQIVKYVPVRDCSLDGEWVRLHNASAKGEFPEASRNVDASTKPLADIN